MKYVYILGGILLILILLFLCYRRYLIRKVRKMSLEEKEALLFALSSPFGFFYFLPQDIFTSCLSAWQHAFGYTHAFDKHALSFHMDFDCEPIYFDYCGKTWLIEFWKGQYGINTGSEVGIYHTDTCIDPSKYSSALFSGISEEEYLPIRCTLFKNGVPLYTIARCHWWLTGFRMGLFSRKEELSLLTSITFPNHTMLCAFLEGMERAGYNQCQYSVQWLTVTFSFFIPHAPQPVHCWLRHLLTAWKNRFHCWLYRWFTRPFRGTLDRLIFLRGFLPPFFFRSVCRIKKRRFYKQKRRRHL